MAFCSEEDGEWGQRDDEDGYDEEDEQEQPSLDDLFEQKFKNSNLTLDTYCSFSYPLYYLAIASTENVARRGFPAEIDPDLMAVQPEWEQQLRDCAKELGIDLGDKKPGWYLASYWDQ